MIAVCLSILWSVSVHASLIIEQWHTSKGTKVLYASAPSLPMVDVRMVFDAGSARDSQHYGLAYLTSQLIGMGDQQRDEEAFSAAIEALGVQFSTQVLKDMALISLRSLNRDEVLQPALRLAAIAIAQPKFQAEVLAREKRNLITALQAKQQSAASVASERFWHKLYGDHPYAHAVEGNMNTVAQITDADLKAFHQRYYTTSNATVAIVGQLDKQQAMQLAETLTQNLPIGDPAPNLPAVTQQPAAGIEEIEFPSSQTQLMIGQLGVSRHDPDYVALYLANHILGGSGFASYLMEEVREKRGLVYGVGSSLLPMRVTGPWYVSLKTANANRHEALKVTQETVLRMLKDISQEDIDAHKDNVLGGFALEVDSNKEIVGYLAMMGFYQLPLDWLDQFPAQVRALTRDQLMTVVQKRLQPERWTGIALGQMKATANATPVALPASGDGGRH
jgi:zinc protease